MANTWSRRPLIGVVLTAGWLTAACSSASGQRETDAIGSSGANSAVIAIERTSSYLTIENRAGLPLVDVRLVLKAANGLTFSTVISRLEASAKRDIPFGELRSPDGTTFSPQWQRAREIAVTATDFVGKKYKLTVPWK